MSTFDQFLYLLYFFLTWASIHWFLSYLSGSIRRRRSLPPGPTPLPIFGNLFSLGDKPHVSLARLAQTYGPIMSLRLGSLATVVISSSSVAKEVLQKQDVSFSDRPQLEVIRARSHSEFSIVWLPPTAEWRNLRKLANSQVFSSSRLDASSHLRKAKVEELLQYVDSRCRAGLPVNVGLAAFNTSLNLLSNTFFSKDMADDQLPSVHSSSSSKTAAAAAANGNANGWTDLQELVRKIMEEVGKPNLSDYFPWAKRLDPQGIKGKMEIYFDHLLSVFDSIIDERLKYLKTTSSSRSTNYTDALGALLHNITPENDEVFNLQHIRHMLVDLFAAGTDTTSSALEWAMTELLRAPTKMKIVQEELELVIGRENPVEETADHISKLPYLQAVIKETFRLHPPAPLLVPRKAVNDVNVCGYIVPKGSQVLINVWAIGKDPKEWENANCFEPERFLGSNIDFKGQHFELIPFGAGRRICPGMSLAARMLPMMLASLIHSFDWKLQDGVTPQTLNMDEKCGITLAKAQSLMLIPSRKNGRSSLA